MGISTISGFPRNVHSIHVGLRLENVGTFGGMERDFVYNQYFSSRLSVNFTKNT